MKDQIIEKNMEDQIKINEMNRISERIQSQLGQ